MTPSDLDTLVTIIGAFCLGAGFVAMLVPFLDREVLVTRDPYMHRELALEGHRVRLVTSDEWIDMLEKQARQDALNAGIDA
jgi:hypothetical protein